MKQEECSNCGLVQYGFTSKDLKYRMSIHKLSKKCREVFEERKEIPNEPIWFPKLSENFMEHSDKKQKEVKEDV